MVKTCPFEDLINPFISTPRRELIAYFLKKERYSKFILEEKFHAFHKSHQIHITPLPHHFYWKFN